MGNRYIDQRNQFPSISSTMTNNVASDCLSTWYWVPLDFQTSENVTSPHVWTLNLWKLHHQVIRSCIELDTLQISDVEVPRMKGQVGKDPVQTFHGLQASGYILWILWIYFGLYSNGFILSKFLVFHWSQLSHFQSCLTSNVSLICSHFLSDLPWPLSSP